MTEAERKLWKALRGRQLEGFKFRRQHPYNDYILDFVCLDLKIAIEIDGGQHQEQRLEDQARAKFLNDAGFSVLRFWNHEVLQQTESVVVRIWQEAARIKAHPHPSPLLEGEGEVLVDDAVHPPLQGEERGGDGAS